MLARFVVLALAASLRAPLPVAAQSGTYVLQWFSQIDRELAGAARPLLACEGVLAPGARCRVGQPGPSTWPVTTQINGQGSATLAVVGPDRLRITFDVGADRAVLDVRPQADLGLSVEGTAPAFFPPEMWAGGGIALQRVVLGGFEWAGRFEAPDAFVVTAGVPASGESTSEMMFLGFATRRPPLSAAMPYLRAATSVSGVHTVVMQIGGAAGASSTVTLAVDGRVVSTQTLRGDPANASFDWDTSTVANGPHTLTLTARDAGGQTATESRVVTVSNVVPLFTASIISPRENAIAKGSLSVGLSTTARWGTPKTVTLSVDGTVVLSRTMTGTTLWWTWNSKLVGNGARTLTLRVTDHQGVTASATRTVTVRN